MSMLSISKRHLMIFLVGFGLTLVLAGLVPLVMAQDATATPEPVATSESAAATADVPTPTGNNSYCAVCHNQPWRSKTLENGKTMNLYVDPEVLEGSVHGINNPEGTLGCIDCHGTDAFPHNKADPTDTRSYSLVSIERCYSCHEKQRAELESGLHEEAIRAGNTQAAVCTDCHGSHDIQRVASEPGLVAGVCGDCHTMTLTEWQSSAHVDIGPQGCATCHSPHSQRLRIDSTNAGGKPDDLCMNCHKPAELPNLWVHTQHRDNLGTELSVPCVDCHMYSSEGVSLTDQTSNTTSAFDLTVSTGHSMRMDTTPCTSCHTQLVSESVPTADATTTTSGETIDTATQAQAESNEAATANDGDQTGFIQLIQGLVLGLGFGITGAVVFITRGNRRG